MADKNVIIKQKLKNEIVDFYPKTKSNIVVNNSTNVTGGTVTDVFNNALPIKAGEHISITPDASGVKIDFTGSLAPNVTVKGVDDNPILVSEEKNDTSAKYTVSHFTAGPSAEYTSGNATTAISGGESKTIKIPQLHVDNYGHVTSAADEDVKITIPSTANMVTGTGLTDNKIILGNVDSKIKTSPYGIITSSNTKNIDDTYIPTSKWIENRINKKITEGAQYLGLVKGINPDGSLVDIVNNKTIIPNSQGDWVRVATVLPDVPSFTNYETSSPTIDTELAHVGDILIYHSTSSGIYLWDVIHTEIDNNTWRPIQVDGTDIGSTTTLNLKPGTNIGLNNNNGAITISATDTTYKLGQNPGASNTVTLTPNSGSVQVVTIDNVANATTATQVANWLTIQLNGGTTENTNQFTYNGSAAKTINITASKVGAAASSHSHGQINNSGEITALGTTIQNGDRILFTDNNDNNKIKRSSITFDGTTETTALTQKGTWKTFLQANQKITINSGTNKDGSAITGTASGTAPTLGDSGITPGTYCALTVNSKGIAVAGSHVIKYYISGTTNNTIQTDTMLAEGGFAFVEIA